VFLAALTAVRMYGGLLEHPWASKAWAWFGLTRPPSSGGWVKADAFGGMTCCVEQGHYGHPARKQSLLYACGIPTPDLIWGSSGQRLVGPDSRSALAAVELRQRTPTAQELADTSYKRRRRMGVVEASPKSQRHLTPIPFRDLLLSLVAA